MLNKCQHGRFAKAYLQEILQLSQLFSFRSLQQGRRLFGILHYVLLVHTDGIHYCTMLTDKTDTQLRVLRYY